jgi:hyperosmotically inducible periplasmic protein
MTTRTLAALLILGGSVATFATGCSSSPTRKSTGEYIDDAGITAKVKAAFVKDPAVKALAVNVDTFKGTVQLNGFVDTAEEKARAEQIARGVTGVVGVQNALTVKTTAGR